MTRARLAVGVLVLLVAGLLAGCELPGMVLQGRVTDEATAAPAAGVPVRVYEADSETLVAETVTNAQGWYYLRPTELPDGTYRVRFSADEWWEGGTDWATADDVVLSAAAPTRLDAAVTPVVGQVSGLVTDGTDPIWGATVHAVSTLTGEVIATTSLNEGSAFQFTDLAAGSYRFRAEASGYGIRYAPGALLAADALEVTVGPDESVVVPDIVLPPESVLSGTVVDGSTPLEGILVVVEVVGGTEPSQVAYTGSDGSFSVGALSAADYAVRLVDLSLQRPSVVVNDGDTPAVPLTFGPDEGANLDIGKVEMSTGQLVQPRPIASAVAAGRWNACALDVESSIVCWGSGAGGATTPPDGTYTEIDMGWNTGCALAPDQTLSCWGDNSRGQATPPLGTYSDVSVGDMHACAIATDATLACWGYNSYGQATAPPGTFISVAAGDSFTCAVTTEQALSCWGSNYLGRTTAPPGTFTAVGAGAAHACALATGGAVVCWGDNAAGQATAIPGNYVALAVGSNHTCALEMDTTITCWGSEYGGRPPASPTTYASIAAGYGLTCGIASADSTLSCWGDSSYGSTSPPFGSYTAIDASSSAYDTCLVSSSGAIRCLQGADHPGTYTAVAVGASHGCALRPDATLSCWGQSTPPGTYTAVDAGDGHTCAIATDATLSCWGRNNHGQATAPPGTYTALGLGDHHSCAITTGGAVECWGYNGFGETIEPPGTFTAVAAGYSHSCAIATDATVTCWGRNQYGEAIAPPGTFRALALGYAHTCGLTTAGTVTCWGHSFYGSAAAFPGTYVALTAGAGGTCGLRADGTYRCVGGPSNSGWLAAS